jgi:hypothetical protein
MLQRKVVAKKLVSMTAPALLIPLAMMVNALSGMGNCLM